MKKIISRLLWVVLAISLLFCHFSWLVYDTKRSERYQESLKADDEYIDQAIEKVVDYLTQEPMNESELEKRVNELFYVKHQGTKDELVEIVKALHQLPEGELKRCVDELYDAICKVK